MAFRMGTREGAYNMSETKALFTQLFKIIIYFIPFYYHSRKQYTIHHRHPTVRRYHYEMADHYFEKIYGKGV